MTDFQSIVELQARVRRLERQVRYLLQRFGLDDIPEDEAGVDPDVLAAVRAGQKITAIKLYRERTGVDLRAAKEYVDSLE